MKKIILLAIILCLISPNFAFAGGFTPEQFAETTVLLFEKGDVLKNITYDYNEKNKTLLFNIQTNEIKLFITEEDLQLSLYKFLVSIVNGWNKVGNGQNFQIALSVTDMQVNNGIIITLDGKVIFYIDGEVTNQKKQLDTEEITIESL